MGVILRQITKTTGRGFCIEAVIRHWSVAQYSHGEIAQSHTILLCLRLCITQYVDSESLNLLTGHCFRAWGKKYLHYKGFFCVTIRQITIASGRFLNRRLLHPISYFAIAEINWHVAAGWIAFPGEKTTSHDELLDRITLHGKWVGL